MTQPACALCQGQICLDADMGSDLLLPLLTRRCHAYPVLRQRRLLLGALPQAHTSASCPGVAVTFQSIVPLVSAPSSMSCRHLSDLPKGLAGRPWGLASQQLQT